MEKLKEIYSNVMGTTNDEKGYEPIDMERLVGSPEMERRASQRSTQDEDDDDLRPSRPPPSPTVASTPAPVSRVAFFFWVAVNCLSTLAIVLCNKRILSNPTLHGAPTLFVAYHFALTAITLHIASSSWVGGFERKRTPIISVMPLCFVFAFHTVITNWSLALLEVAIYQELRILVTPATVLINFLAYQRTISLRSMLALAVVCGGIAVTIYSDTQQKLALASKAGSSIHHVRAAISSAEGSLGGAHPLKNTPIGYAFGIAGVSLSALYTVWLAVYLTKLKCSSMQLLHMQAPVGCLLLLAFVPFLDTMPVWSDITSYQYFLLAASGLSAVLINISQFFIVAGSSAVSSTVVGHAKTCLIVSVGWATASSALALESGLGIMVAICGIISYSVIGLQESKAKAAAAASPAH